MSTALVQEHELITKARGLMAQTAQVSTLVQRAKVTAQGVQKGLVITTEAEATAATDQAVAIAAGIRELDAARKKLSEIPRAATAAINDYANAIIRDLEAAKKVLDNANAGFILRERERLEAERVAAEAKAQEDAVADAAETGEEAVPLVGPSEVRAQTMVRGAAGAQVMQEHLQCAWAENRLPHQWAILNEAAAKAWFREQLRRGELEKPKAGVRLVRCGVVFWYDARMATREAR